MIRLGLRKKNQKLPNGDFICFVAILLWVIDFDHENYQEK